MAKTVKYIDENGQECRECGEYKTWTHFSKNKKMQTGFINICKDCKYKKIRDNYVVKARDNTNFHKKINIQLRDIFGYKKYMVIPIEGGYFRIRCYTQTGHFIKMKGGEFTKEKIEEFLNSNIKNQIKEIDK